MNYGRSLLKDRKFDSVWHLQRSLQVTGQNLNLPPSARHHRFATPSIYHLRNAASCQTLCVHRAGRQPSELSDDVCQRILHPATRLATPSTHYLQTPRALISALDVCTMPPTTLGHTHGHRESDNRRIHDNECIVCAC